MKWPEHWKTVTEQAKELEAELHRELHPRHQLFGIPLKAVARRLDRDDVLFELQDGSSQHALVHLTWSQQSEQQPEWPSTVVFADLASFVRHAATNNDAEA